jgi:colicin import membrane protein
MRPIEFSSESVIKAGQDLQAAGRNVTGFALRQKVGGGSAGRLKQVWDEYIASSSVTHVEPVAELPIEVAEQVAAVTKSLTDRLASLAVELNDKAVKAAERRVSEVVRAAGEQREQAERELVDAATTVDELESAIDVAQAEIASRDERVAKLSTDLQAQAVKLASVQSEAKHLQT